MIKFFRHIRQNLLIEGKTSKYFKYAIGEIVLVVIGILIALQINNWNEQRKAESTTFIYVENLIEDIKKDTLMYADQINAATLKYQYCKDIYNVIYEGQKTKDTAKFIISLQSAGRLIVPTTTDNTYQDLLNTGNLKLIKDKQSIEAIRDYYSNPLYWWYQDYKDQLVNGYLPVVVDAIPMYIHEQILTNEIVDEYKDFTDNALLNNHLDHYSEEDFTQIINNLKTNADFRFQLKRITRSHLVQIKILGLSSKSANSLLKTLEKWKNENNKYN
ncbi:DUF6090 family protein [Geojedonia litorea]|uniref:DUF6090 family protein n=1 Tax=Geojedonia litorea TaxID=1268269 RepID=A0ABV9N097_9FLAO